MVAKWSTCRLHLAVCKSVTNKAERQCLEALLTVDLQKTSSDTLSMAVNKPTAINKTLEIGGGVGFVRAFSERPVVYTKKMYFIIQQSSIYTILYTIKP